MQGVKLAPELKKKKIEIFFEGFRNHHMNDV